MVWRSGFCRSLNSFNFNSFTAALNDGGPTCPECGTEPQTTGHLFYCGANPLPCEVADLWCNPLHAAHSLSSLPLAIFPLSALPLPLGSLVLFLELLLLPLNPPPSPPPSPLFPLHHLAH